MTVALLLLSSYEPQGTLQALHPITSDTIKQTKDSGTVTCENKGALCVPVIRMFFRMCLGVSPSSKDIRAAVLDSLWTLLVGGNDFVVVILLEESTQFNSKFRIYVTGMSPPHQAHFLSQVSSQYVLWCLTNIVLITQSAAAPGHAETLCFGHTKDGKSSTSGRIGCKGETIISLCERNPCVCCHVPV